MGAAIDVAMHLPAKSDRECGDGLAALLDLEPHTGSAIDQFSRLAHRYA